MKIRSLMVSLCMMAVLMTSGCRHCYCNCPAPCPPVAKVPAPTPVIVPVPVSVPAPAPKPVIEMIKLVAENRDALRVFISGEGATESERQLAERLVFQVKSGLASDRARVQTEMRGADAILAIRPHLTTVDHDGNYWRLNCDVHAELRSFDAKRVFAAKSVKFVAPRRVLGLENAVRQFEDEGGKAVGDWCAKELKHVLDRDVDVALLRIELRQAPSFAVRNTAEDTRCIAGISEGLKRMQGVVAHELAGRDTEHGTCTFRVVYFRESYPNGIGTGVSIMANRDVLHR